MGFPSRTHGHERGHQNGKHDGGFHFGLPIVQQCYVRQTSLTQAESGVKCGYMTAEEVKILRARSGQSLAQFAKLFGVTRQAIWHWEQRGTPSTGSGRYHVERVLLLKFGIRPKD
jgi:hypothetical protein